MRVLNRSLSGDRYRLQIQLRFLPKDGKPTSNTKSFTLVANEGDKHLKIDTLVNACFGKLQEIYDELQWEE